MKKDNVYYNINGGAYGEDKNAFTRSFEITCDLYGFEFHGYAINQMVVWRPTERNVKNGETVHYKCGRFFESLALFGDDFFDGGVYNVTVDAYGTGWDHSDFDIALRELVADWLAGREDKDYEEVYAAIQYEEVDSYVSEHTAMYHYDKVK